MKFDSTITLGSLIDAGLVVAAIIAGIFKIRSQLRELLVIMKEFPPHRHVKMNDRDKIIYPKGMEPNT